MSQEVIRVSLPLVVLIIKCTTDCLGPPRAHTFKMTHTPCKCHLFLYRDCEPTISLQLERMHRLPSTARHFVWVLALCPDLLYHDVVGSSAWLHFTFLFYCPSCSQAGRQRGTRENPCRAQMHRKTPPVHMMLCTVSPMTNCVLWYISSTVLHSSLDWGTISQTDILCLIFASRCIWKAPTLQTWSTSQGQLSPYVAALFCTV